MTHAYAATKLFEHGPLTFAEFWEITGWSQPMADKVLRNLVRWGVVRAYTERGTNRYIYRLAV